MVRGGGELCGEVGNGMGKGNGGGRRNGGGRGERRGKEGNGVGRGRMVWGGGE